MTPEAHAVAVPRTASHWGLVGTLLWGALIVLAFVLLQLIVMGAYLAWGKPNLSETELRELIQGSLDNGAVLSLVTLATTLICVPLVLGVARLKRGSRLKDYLAIKRVPWRTLGVWLVITAAFIALSDTLTVVLGRRIVPEFMASAYASANPQWLMWLAFIIGAPLFEEIFFRGFLYKGFEPALKPIGAVLVTAAGWAVIHLQYDMYGIGTIFITGILFGIARMRTQSVVTPLAMHVLTNFVACSEAALLATNAVA